MIKVSIICAMDKNRGIGKNNKLLFRIPEDMERFKELTSGHTIIMGRKTFESIGRVLPNRINVIITRDPNYRMDDAVVVHSLEEALRQAQAFGSEAQDRRGDNECFVIGGGQIYEQALPFTDKLYLTIVEGIFEADTFFPDYSEFKKITFEQEGESDEYKYKFLELERR